MIECRFCKEEIKDNAIKCWHCNTMLRRELFPWLLLIAFFLSALYSWIMTHQEHGHILMGCDSLWGADDLWGESALLPKHLTRLCRETH